MLAMEMKASGKYVSRGLSFKDAEFEQHVVTLTKDQRKMYDDACGMISLIRSACIEAREGRAWRRKVYGVRIGASTSASSNCCVLV